MAEGKNLHVELLFRECNLKLLDFEAAGAPAVRSGLTTGAECSSSSVAMSFTQNALQAKRLTSTALCAARSARLETRTLDTFVCAEQRRHRRLNYQHQQGHGVKCRGL